MSDDKKKFSKLVLVERDNQELEMKVQEFLSDKVIVDESEYEALKDEIRRHEEVFQFSANKIAALKRENGVVKSLVVGRVAGEWPDGFDNEPDDWEEWSLQLYGHEAGDLLLGQEAWDHIMRGLKRDALLEEQE